MADQVKGDGLSWRQRVRDIATRDILRVARELLEDGGSAELTVRAVARQLGMSSQAMYRYYDSYETMMAAVVMDILDEVAGLLETTAGFRGDDDHSTAENILRGSRVLRQWAIDHPCQFQVTMATPKNQDDDELRNSRYRFGRVFARLFAQHWYECGCPNWAEDGPPDLLVAAQFERHIELPCPDEIVMVFLRCWIRLYGVICMEAMGQLAFLGEQSGAFFEAELHELSEWLGIQKNGQPSSN